LVVASADAPTIVNATSIHQPIRRHDAVLVIPPLNTLVTSILAPNNDTLSRRTLVTVT
jgi:hypothetical protein